MYANRNGTKPATDITPIYSEEAEQSALGSAIIDPEALAVLVDMLRPEHFWARSLRRHRRRALYR